MQSNNRSGTYNVLLMPASLLMIMSLVRKWVLINQWVSGNRIMCCIPGTWYYSSTVSITVEEFCQQRKKKNLDREYWRIVPATIEESCQWKLKNCACDFWRIMLATVEQSCQGLLKNCASDCWTTVPATVQQVNTLVIMSVRKYLLGWLVSYKIQSNYCH